MRERKRETQRERERGGEREQCNKVIAQIISNRKFKLWAIRQGTEARVATFRAERCIMSYESK